MEGAEDTGNWNMSMPQELACLPEGRTGKFVHEDAPLCRREASPCGGAEGVGKHLDIRQMGKTSSKCHQC